MQVQLDMSGVQVRLSQFAKREVHSLVNYLLRSFSDQDVTLFTRHFVKVRQGNKGYVHCTFLGCVRGSARLVCPGLWLLSLDISE